MAINHIQMIDILPNLTMIKDINMIEEILIIIAVISIEETLLMIVVVLTEMIQDILLMIHETIMTEMIQNILLMIHETIMIQDILLMIHEIIMTEMIQDILLMIHETIMIQDILLIINEIQIIVLHFMEAMRDLEKVFKVMEVPIIFKIIGKIEVVKVLEVHKTLMFSFNQIIQETHIINFPQEKGSQQKNCNNC